VDIYSEIVRIRELGGRAALATIVRRVGSTPRKDCAKMLVREDGSSLGSVGGGCVEGEIWQKAREVMDTGRPQLVSFELNSRDAENEGLICGGTVDVFVEPIMSDPKLYILGAGHLGLALGELGHRVGFQVTVVDDRERFASRERFPSAEQVLVRPFDGCLVDLPVDRNSYVVIVTRGHSHDCTATEQAIQTQARYVGLVGSRRKIKLIAETLIEKGYTAEHFSNLFAPIGLPIGSETPEEIAVSVIAELIAVGRGMHQRSEKQEFIRKSIQQVFSKSESPGTTEPQAK
jgi:xanthine dehydrogenase accessory factor